MIILIVFLYLMNPLRNESPTKPRTFGKWQFPEKKPLLIWKKETKLKDQPKKLIKSYEDLPQHYLGRQAEINLIKNFWNNPDQLSNQKWHEIMIHYQNWRQIHMLMFEIVDGKGIIDTHGLMIKSIVFLQRKTQKWYKQIFDRLFQYWSSGQNNNPQEIKKHIVEHMKNNFFILAMIPGKGKHSRNQDAEKICERIPKQFTNKHECETCVKFFTSQNQKEGEDIVLKRIYQIQL